MNEPLNFLLEHYDFIILYPVALYILLNLSLFLVTESHPEDSSLSREFKVKFILQFGWPTLTALIAIILIGWISMTAMPLSRIDPVPIVFLVAYFLIGILLSAAILVKLRREYK